MLFIALSVVRLVDISRDDDFHAALRMEWAAAVVILHCSAGLLFVGALSGFHLYLLATNQTTYEYFRGRGSDNSFHRNLFQNCAEAACGRTRLYAYYPDGSHPTLMSPNIVSQQQQQASARSNLQRPHGNATQRVSVPSNGEHSARRSSQPYGSATHGNGHSNSHHSSGKYDTQYADDDAMLPMPSGVEMLPMPSGVEMLPVRSMQHRQGSLQALQSPSGHHGTAAAARRLPCDDQRGHSTQPQSPPATHHPWQPQSPVHAPPGAQQPYSPHHSGHPPYVQHMPPLPHAHHAPAPAGPCQDAPPQAQLPGAEARARAQPSRRRLDPPSERSNGSAHRGPGRRRVRAACKLPAARARPAGGCQQLPLAVNAPSLF